MAIHVNSHWTGLDILKYKINWGFTPINLIFTDFDIHHILLPYGHQGGHTVVGG